MLESVGDVLDAVYDALIIDGDEQLFAVGGAVRDELANLPINDVDFTTNLLPEQIWNRLEAAAKNPSSLVMNVFDVGMDQGGTVGTMIDRSPGHEPLRVEVTTMRAETYPHGDRRRPEVVFGTNVIEDLGRRDFTINAMAYNIATGHLIDPFDGVVDLQSRVLRAVGDANQRMIDDPVRILRAARFLSKFDISPEHDLVVAVQDNCNLLAGETPERIFKELKEILKAPGAFRGMNFLYSTGAMDIFLPEVSRLGGIKQPPKYHEHDVLMHTMYALHAGAQAGVSVLMMLALLFHDTGKYVTFDDSSGDIHFYGHERISRDIVKEVFSRWNASNDETRIVSHVVRNHMRPHHVDFTNEASVRKFVNKVDVVREDELVVSAEDLCLHAMFDSVGSSKDSAITAPVILESQLLAIDKARSYLPPVNHHLSPLDGREIMSILNVVSGEIIGEAKRHLAGLVLEGTVEPGDKHAAVEKLLIWFYDYQIGAEAS